jgi:hypothetical protein
VKRLIIFLLVVSLAACSNRKSIPKDIIQLDTMQVIMKEMILTGEYALQYISKDSLNHDKAKSNQDLMENIFKLHHITRTDFKKSLSFYEARPDLNKIIFDSLAAEANRHKTEIYSPRTITGKTPLTAPKVIPGRTPLTTPGTIPGRTPLTKSATIPGRTPPTTPRKVP